MVVVIRYEGPKGGPGMPEVRAVYARVCFGGHYIYIYIYVMTKIYSTNVQSDPWIFFRIHTDAHAH